MSKIGTEISRTAVRASAVLLEKGINLSATSLYLGISTLGQLAGMLLGALFADRIQRHDAILFCAALMAVAALMFAGSRQPLWLILTNLTFSVAAGLRSAFHRVRPRPH